jgi:hypothetical protein
MSSKLVILSNPVSEDRDSDFNTWYNEVHIPEILAEPGFLKAERYRAVARIPGEGPPAYRYLAIYEINSVADALAINAKASQLTMTDAIDAEGAIGAAFEKIFIMTAADDEQ